MNVTRCDIAGLLIIEPKVFGDARGFFMEMWNEQRYREAGLHTRFVQDNLSSSRRGTLRGLHFQNPNSQGKLVWVIEGEVFDDAETAAEKFSAETGRVFIHPFEHHDVIAGQGTAGLEMADDTAIGTVVVPVGGGGLISGIAAAVKARQPMARVVGVQAASAAAVVASRRAGEPVVLSSVHTFCDGIAVKRPGDLTMAHMDALVDDVVAVDDEATARAVGLLLERAKLVVEPAGAVAVAALLEHAIEPAPPPVVAVLSGGNVDPLLLLQIVRYGLSSAGT